MRLDGGQLYSEGGNERFPVVDGVPVLLDDSRSAFSTTAFVGQTHDARGGLWHLLRGLLRSHLPRISHNLAAAGNYRQILSELDKSDRAEHVVLVVGGAIMGDGFDVMASAPAVRLVETDVAFGPRTQLICDGLALPFASGSFDAVVCQAVLEHVSDPQQAVEEIHRVLKPQGLVYSEIPFMQQVHEGLHDFTRFTLVGHRRLYRHFDCLALGVTAGPATSLAWSLKYLLLPFGGRSPWRRAAMSAVLNMMLSWLKYFDYLYARLPTASDGASGTYLLGRRSDRFLSDREVLAEFGADGSGFRLIRE